MVRLPAGFSPVRFAQQIGSYANPTGGTADYDVFGDTTARGGVREPINGSLVGPQVEGAYTINTGSGGGADGSWDSPQVAGATTTQTPETTPTPSPTGVVDPLAAERASYLSQFPSALQNVRTNAGDAFGSAGRTLRGTAEGLFNTVNQGQRAINTSRENVELNRLSGVKDILGFVRNGLRSGGTRLANMNAGESSAVGELGRAYGMIGSDRMRGVGNKAFLENRGIDTNQEELELKKGQGRTDFSRSRDEMVSTIGSQVRNQLAELEQKGLALGVDPVDVEAEKQRIIDEGIGQINEVDGWLQGQLGGVRPQDMATTRTNAVALQQGGTGNITPFDFGEFAGQQVQGPAIDQLPLFTRNRRVER